MPIHPLKRLEDKTRDLVMYLDYFMYLLLNPFKFKPFPKKIQRILVVELLKVGDLLVATPTVRALKEKWKNAEIDMLVAPECAELLKRNTDVHESIPYTTFEKIQKKTEREKI